MTVSILGIATAIPEFSWRPSVFDGFVRKWTQPSVAVDRTLKINQNTEINIRPSLHDETSEIIARDTPPPIQDVNAFFREHGIPLAAKACRRAIADWGRSSGEITHLICTTCTSTLHPGYDLYLHQQLGLKSSVERTLLHGIGCAGGMAILRMARQVCLAAEAQGRTARVLIVALEVCSSGVRTELQSLDEETAAGGKKPNVAATIFSDASSAMIIGSGGLRDGEHQFFEVLESIADTIPDTAADLAFDADQNGWRAILSVDVPEITATAVPFAYKRLLSNAAKREHTLPQVLPSTPANELDWFIHTGGSLILRALGELLEIDKSQLAPSWDMYRRRGNSSSASIGGVIERGRDLGGREAVVAVAFGPGVSVEMALLRRCPVRTVVPHLKRSFEEMHATVVIENA